MIPSIDTRSISKLMFPFMLALAAMLGGWQESCASEVYKWVDEQHAVQYSQTPPPRGVQFSRMSVKQAPPPANDPADSAGDDGSSVEDRAKALDEQHTAQQKAAADAKEAVDIAKLRQQNCVTAKNNLMLLNQGGHLSYRDKDGNLVRLTEEDRVNRTAQAKQHIAEYCSKQ